MKDVNPHLGQAAFIFGPPLPDFVSDLLLLAIGATVTAAATCALVAWRARARVNSGAQRPKPNLEFGTRQ